MQHGQHPELNKILSCFLVTNKEIKIVANAKILVATWYNDRKSERKKPGTGLKYHIFGFWFLVESPN